MRQGFTTISVLVLALCLATQAYSDESTVSGEGTITETSSARITKVKPESLEEEKNNSTGQYLYEFTQAIASGSTIGTVDALEELFKHSSILVRDLQLTATKLQQNRTGDMSLVLTLVLLIGIFPVAFGLEKITRYLFGRYLGRSDEEDNNGQINHFTWSLSSLTSQAFTILLYSLYCVVLFNLSHGDDATITLRAIFFSALSMLILGRAVSAAATAYLGSEASLTDPGKKQVLHGFMFAVWTICLVLFIGVCFQHLSISRESLELFTIGTSTLNQLIILFVFLYYRKNISSFLNQYFQCGTRDNLCICRIVTIWIIPISLYLTAIWALQIHRIYYQSTVGEGAYFVSLLAIPLYFVLVRIGSWIVKTAIKTLNLYRPGKEENVETCQMQEEEFIAKACKYVHPVMSLGLAVWVLKKWGYELPFISERAGAVLSITITIGVTLLAWHLITGMIEKKLKTDQQEERNEDDEWGADSAQGREHTLLPVLKKCVGTILALIALLTCLSSLGINIGPILAGAGVLGIAIGFGSQKVVSDILSGFFFLMDDSFRVGEYIETGTVKGRVEEITLRNVLLRHHRGMLQIVPFSELGAVTNYMRGGIIEKFNLELPYDTDVDKVRKIIKKVGLAMLEDEEYGEDFIRPLKSQGVREISNSVMVIRAKFTAKPGKHFVIRREAFRRVTEALNAKGVYYAHRKVIVDIPESTVSQTQALEQAGAAALAAEQDSKK